MTVSLSHPINGTFKGRGRDYLTLLACPVDGARLIRGGGDLVCTHDAAHRYAWQGGVLRLASPERLPALAEESAAHEADCAVAGWVSPDEAQFKALPAGGLGGYPEAYWETYAAATVTLWQALESARLADGGLPVGPAGEAAVIGAGMGWLAYALDVAGFATVALDVHTGPRYGLGVYPIARYLRVQAAWDRLPLARGAFDWVIVQSGMGRFGDTAAQERGAEAIFAALRPGGRVVVIEEPTDGLAASSEALWAAQKFSAERADLPRTWRRRWQDWRRGLRGDQPPAPEVVVARKPV